MQNVASVDGKSPSDDKEYEVIKPVINVKKEVSKTLVSVNEEFYYDITVTKRWNRCWKYSYNRYNSKWVNIQWICKTN